MTDQDRWRQAATLKGLGELTALWLEGAIQCNPGYSASGPDSETEELVPVLAAINRAGFVTINSQPGEDGAGYRQRATVCGFCEEPTAMRIYRGLVETDLLVLAYPPGPEDNGMRQVPVTIWTDEDGPGHEYQELCPNGVLINTWTAGHVPSEHIADMYGQVLDSRAIAALEDAWQVEVVDTRWGRNDLLWPELSAVFA